MPNRRLLPLLALLFVALRATAADVPDSAGAEALPHRLLVKLDSTSRSPISDARERIGAFVSQFGISTIASWLPPSLLKRTPRPMLKPALGGNDLTRRLSALGRIVVIEYSAPYAPAYVAGKLSRLHGIEYAEPVYRRTFEFLPNDPFFPQQQSYLEQIRAIEGWDVTRADQDVVIGIVDTGVDLTHPDLRSAIWNNPGETGRDLQGRDKRTNGVDDDGNGLVDDWTGYDFGGTDGYSPDNDPSPGYSHGTHVAGIAAASGNNATGVIGIAFGARLMPVKIADDNPINPTLTAGFQGILYAATMGASIINCSWGGAGRSQAEQEVIDAVTEMGTLVVAAAGNEGRSLPSYPAGYRGVLSVASVTGSDQRSIFSNFNTSVGISAPGEDIYSTVPLSLNTGGYRAERGTSMASPLVAGAAALVLSRYPGLLPEQIAAVLRANADDINAGNPSYAWLLGSGRLNIERALTVGPDVVAAEIVDYSVIEGDANGIIEPGETVELRITVKNILKQSNDISLDLAPISDPGVQVLAPSQDFGALASGETRQSTSGNFRLVMPTGVPIDYHLALSLTLREQGRIIGVQRIELLVNPNYSTTEANRITATFTGNGRIGFSDFPLNELGRGFRFDSTGLLAEGGLMIGVNATRLADVVRNTDGLQNQWLETIEPYRVHFSSDENVEIGRAHFDDAHLIDLQRVGVDIHLTTYEYTGIDQEKQVLAFYRIANTSGARLDSLFCGLFLDWDLGPSGADNQIQFDPEDRMGYISNVTDASLPLVGSVLVSNQPMNFTALENNAPPISDGFGQLAKWDALSSGIHHEVSRVSDCSMTIGAGPITLEAGADTTITFAFIVGDDVTELRQGAAEARRLAEHLGQSVGGPIPLPSQVKLVDIGPNPFDNRTTIEFWMPDEGHVTIRAFDAIGRQVATLIDGVYRRGVHTVDFVPESSSGFYFIQLDAFGETHMQKLIRLQP
jgi:subtilisin family serine protease